jgi:hypothetical protein
MRILFDADPDPTFYLDADLDPSFQIRLKKKCSNRLIFHTFWFVFYKLMRIRLITWMRIRILIFI